MNLLINKYINLSFLTKLGTLLSLLFLCNVIAVAQVRLHGKVTDENGQPMEMVHIRLSKGSVGTLSNFKGEYEMLVSESDTLRVIFTSLGYKRLERLINTSNVKPNESGHKHLSLNVQLRPNESVLNDVEVVAQRQVQPGNLEHFTVENIQHMRSASGNAVEDMLGTMAGVNMNNELSSQYSVRGGSFDENLVYVNGIEVYRPQLIASGQQEGLSFVNPSMVGSLEFSTGGFTSQYGDKMSSVLDITYRKPEAFDADASVSLMGASASLGQRAGDFTQLHGVRFKRNSTILNSLDTKGEYDPIFFDYQTYLTWNFGENKNWEAAFLGNVAINDYRFVPESRETSFGTWQDAHSFKVYFDGQEKDQFHTYFGALTLDYKGLKNTTLSMMASGFWTDEKVTFDISGEYWMDQATDVQQQAVGSYMEHARNKLEASVLALSLRGTTQLGHNKLSYGLSGQLERIDDRIGEWERRDSAGYSLPRDEERLRVINNLHSAYQNTTARLSAFLQDSYGWNAMHGRFFLQAGLRLSYWDFNKEFLVSPRASLRFTPDSSPNWILRLATGIYYQAPFYKEYRLGQEDAFGNKMVEMNSEIKSPRSFQVVMGSDYTFHAYERPFKFTAEAYYKGISDYIPYTVDNVQIRYAGENLGSAYVTGIDMKLFGAFVEGTDSWLSLSLMSSKETYNGLTTPRPTEQRYGVGAFFSDYWPGNNAYKVYLRGVFNDGLPFYSPQGGRKMGTFRTPAYKRVDLGAERVWNADNSKFMNKESWRHIKEFSVGLDFFNLLDIDNTNSYYWVTAVSNQQFAVPNFLTGRMISVSLNFRFQ